MGLVRIRVITRREVKEMTIITIANFSVALQGERSKQELEEIAQRIRKACLTDKDIVYAPSVWLEDYDVRDMEVITPPSPEGVPGGSV